MTVLIELKIFVNLLISAYLHWNFVIKHSYRGIRNRQTWTKCESEDGKFSSLRPTNSDQVNSSGPSHSVFYCEFLRLRPVSHVSTTCLMMMASRLNSLLATHNTTILVL